MSVKRDADRYALNAAARNAMNRALLDTDKAACTMMLLCDHAMYTAENFRQQGYPALLKLECEHCHVVGFRAP